MRAAAFLLLTTAAVACGPTSPGPGGGAGDASAGGADASRWPDAGDAAPPSCDRCSADFTQVIDCGGQVVDTCPADQLCGAGVCMAPCDAAAANKSSVGCDYHAVALGAYGGAFGGCFVAFVANTWPEPVHLQASFAGAPIDLAAHARVPVGNGPSLGYGLYDPVAGLQPGEVAILFLANDPVAHGTWGAPAACPVPAAVGLDAWVHYGLNISTGRGNSFHIASDRPVVAYQMLPYNAAQSASTGASLLLPTSAWDTNYLAATASRAAEFEGLGIPPTMAVIARDDATTITMLPIVAIQAGLDVAGAPAGQPVTYTLDRGQTIEFIQQNELTGSPIQSDKPIALFAGHMGLRVPYNVEWSDHAEQQIPPLRALGSEYALASFRDRVPGFAEGRRHRVIGTVDGTVLTFDPPIAGAPAALQQGTVVEFDSDLAFVVRSQDEDHPFLLFTYMSGSGKLAGQGAPAGYGDSEFVRVVPGRQYLRRYVFFTDPTYPETNLVVVRRRTDDGFADVTLDCAGVLIGWQPLGSDGTYELTRVDLSRHDFEPQGSCDNGRREMSSAAPFGLTVWGWGSPETRAGEQYPCVLGQPDNSCDVSYGYPAGENVVPINEVVIVP